MTLAELNTLLVAGVHLLRFELEAEGVRFHATLSLADRTGVKHTLLCRDVQNLELLPEGDALTKPMNLEVADLRVDGLDRIGFSVEEISRDTLFLHCAGLEWEAIDLDA